MGRARIERFWLGGSALAALLIAVIGYFFLIGPQRSETADVQDRTATAQLANTGLDTRITQLSAQNSKLSTYQRALADARLALPSTSGMPTFLRSLQSIGRATSTVVSSLTVGAAEAPPAAAAAAPASGSSSSSASSSPASPAAGATTAPVAAVLSIPMTATVTGSARQLGAFLTQLQSVQPRAVLITDLVLGGATPAATTTQHVGAGTVSLQLTMRAFVAPVAAATAATPSASPSGGN